MTDKKKKPNQPELVEDSALDEASGGNMTAVQPMALKITTTRAEAWPKKIEIGSLKAGDGSV